MRREGGIKAMGVGKYILTGKAPQYHKYGRGEEREREIENINHFFNNFPNQ